MDVTDVLTSLSRSLGLEVDQLVALRSTNNQVFWLAPSAVAGKVSSDRALAEVEVSVVEQLMRLGAPVVPLIDLEGQPIDSEIGAISFWRYIPQAEARKPGAQELARELLDLHAKLRSVPVLDHVPPVDTAIEAAVGELDHAPLPAELSPADRIMLRSALMRGLDALSRVNRRQPIHGSPHRFNILVVEGRPRFIDFETVALGPREWDLAHLEPAVAEAYEAELSWDLLDSCRLAVSAATATWCWRSLRSGPDMREHAEHHLELVRARIG